MVMTRRGVYHNLLESEYATSNGEVAFFFSSRFYMNKFLDNYKRYRTQFYERINRVMDAENMNIVRLADLYSYKYIEKRGFRVVNLETTNQFKKGDLKWQDSHLYGLWNVTNESTPDWFVMQGPKLDEHRKTMG